MATSVRTFGLLVALLSMLTWLGTPTTRAAGTSYLRLVHASPNIPALDILVDGQRITTALAFATTTSYIAVPSGPHVVQVVAPGAGSGQTLIDTRVDLGAGLAYTFIAEDRAERMAPVVLTDDLTITAGQQSYVRLIHASPDAPSFADIAVAGGAVAYQNLPFKGSSPYLPVTAGTYRFEVRPAGTTQALATTEALTLESGRIYSIIVVGQLSDNTLRALILPDNARVGGIGGLPSTGGGGMAATTSSGAPLPLIAATLALAFFCCCPALLRRLRR